MRLDFEVIAKEWWNDLCDSGYPPCLEEDLYRLGIPALLRIATEQARREVLDELESKFEALSETWSKQPGQVPANMRAGLNAALSYIQDIRDSERGK